MAGKRRAQGRARPAAAAAAQVSNRIQGSTPVRIGLTGTIGSGKSLVADMLQELGAVLIDTDQVARDVVLPGSPGLALIVAQWGGKVLSANGELDRQKLADIVFVDDQQRRKLNGILHPLIGRETAQRMAAAPPGRHVVLAVPLLFESGFEKFVERVWTVAADEETLIARITARDNVSREHALQRIQSQMPQQQKIERSNVVIYNNGSIEDTRRQVRKAWSHIEEL